MKRRVFISFLGTNNYLQTRYDIDGKKSPPVRFVQEALLDSICGDWSESDIIYIFYTKDSKKKNWVDNGQDKLHPQEDAELESKGLESILRAKPYGGLVHGEEIPEGFSKDEIWNMFDHIYKNIQDGDELYFDITHAFRSIPLFSIVLFNFSQFMKNTVLKKICYGAFEKLGPAYIVKTMPVTDRIAPVVDMSDMIRLQNYTSMADSLSSFGRLNKISETLLEYSEDNSVIKQMQSGIEEFDNYLVTNRMSDIKKGAWLIKINNAVKKIKESKIPSPIKDVISKLMNDLRGFKPSDCNENIEAAIEWAKKYKMLSCAYTLGQEYIISLIAEKIEDMNPYTNVEHIKKSAKRTKFRTFLSSVCSISKESIENKEIYGELKKYQDVAEKIWEIDYIKQIREYFPRLGEYRNTLNHGKNSNISYNDLIKDFDDLFYNCLKCLK